MRKSVAGKVINTVNSICLVISTIMMVFGGLLQWGQTFLRLTLLPGVFIMVSKGYGKEAISMAQIAIITDGYLSILSKGGYIIFIIGCVLSNICSLGIIGVCCRKGFLVVMYIVLSSIVVLVIIILIIIFMVKKNQLEVSLGEVLKDTIVKQYKFHNQKPKGPIIDVSGIIDLIQIRGRCCGSYSGKDFYSISTTEPVPFSCCKMNETTFTPLYSSCPSSPNDVNSYYSNGCSSIIWAIIKRFSEYAAYSLIGLGLILFILIMMAIITLGCCGPSKYRMKGHILLM